MKLLKVKNLAHLFGFIWVGSIIAFLGFSYVAMNDGGSYSQSQDTTFIYIILTGIIAFLLAITLYSTHILFLRKKPVVGHSRRSRMPFLLPIMGLLVAFFIFGLLGAYRLGTANNAVEQANNEVIEPTAIPTEAVRYINSNPVEPLSSPTPQSTQPNNQKNLISCTYYGQTFNLTPEDCRYYQGQEAGANRVNNDGYVAPYRNYEQNTTPVPTTPQEKYHSNQSACESTCEFNFPDSSKFRQSCYASCKN